MLPRRCLRRPAATLRPWKGYWALKLGLRLLTTTNPPVKESTGNTRREKRGTFGGLMSKVITESLQNAEDFLVKQAMPPEPEVSPEDTRSIRSKGTTPKGQSLSWTRQQRQNIRCGEPISLLDPTDLYKLRHQALPAVYTESKRARSKGFRAFLDEWNETNEFKPHAALVMYAKGVVKGRKQTEMLVDWLIQSQWFENAAVVIRDMEAHTDFQELVDYIDGLLERGPLASSSWLTYMFLLKLSKVFKETSPQLVPQLSYLQRCQGYNLEKLLFMERLLDVDALNPAKAERDISAFEKDLNFGERDPELRGLQLFMLADLAKKSPDAVMTLLKTENARLVLDELRGFVGSFSRRFMSAAVSAEDKQHRLELLCPIIINTPDLLLTDYLVILRPKLLERSPLLALYKKFVAKKFPKDLPGLPELYSLFATRLSSYGPFMEAEWLNMSGDAQARVLRKYVKWNAMHKFVDCLRRSGNNEHRSFVARRLILEGLSKDRSDVVLKDIVRTVAFLSESLSSDQLPRALADDVVSVLIGRQATDSQFFANNDPQRCLQILIEKIGKHLPDDVLLPVMFRWLREFEIDDPEALAKVSDIFNEHLDYAIRDAQQSGQSKPGNSKKYKSRMYVWRRQLTRECASELIQMKPETAAYFLDRHLQAAASKNMQEKVHQFQKTLLRESVLQEVIVRWFLTPNLPHGVKDTKPTGHGSKHHHHHHHHSMGLEDEEKFFKVQTLFSIILNKSLEAKPSSSSTSRLEGLLASTQRSELDADDENGEDANNEKRKLGTLVDAMLDSEDVDSADASTEAIEDDGMLDDVYKSLMRSCDGLNLEKDTEPGAEEFFDSGSFDSCTSGDQAGAATGISYEKKLRDLRLYTSVRVRSYMLQEFIAKHPEYVDQITGDLYREFQSEVPLALIQSMAIGILEAKELPFSDRISEFKRLDKLGASIYSHKNRTVFKSQVRFRAVNEALVSAIIEESRVCDGGVSMNLLKWAFGKFIHSPSVGSYTPKLLEWSKELQKMHDEKTGFWSKERSKSLEL